MTSEAIPRVSDSGRFIDTAHKIIEFLSHPDIAHEFQDHKTDGEKMQAMVEKEVPPETHILTPESELYHSILKGRQVTPVNISRVADVVDWKTKRYETYFPPCPEEPMVFLDTVSFTGRTIEEVGKRYGLSGAIVELAGQYATKKCQRIGVPLTYGKDVSGYTGLWHLDDMVQWIETEEGAIPPSEFMTTAYNTLKKSRTPEEFSVALQRLKIRREQRSPNLFLELSRPSSYLARSFTQDPEAVKETLPVIRELESLYVHKQRRNQCP